MINLNSGKHFTEPSARSQMTRGGFLKGIFASGIAPSLTIGAVSLAGSANATVGGMMRNVGGGMAVMFGGKKPYDAEVEYLESNNVYSQFIDTGVIPSVSLPFDVKFLVINDLGYGNVFGARLGPRTSEYQVTRYENGSVGVGSRTTIGGVLLNAVNTISYDGESSFVVHNGVNKEITRSPIQSTVGSIVLFAIRQVSIVTQYSNTRIYYIKFGEEFDAIPVVKEGVGYMYDRVKKQLFGNLGTGAFNVGPIKN